MTLRINKIILMYHFIYLGFQQRTVLLAFMSVNGDMKLTTLRKIFLLESAVYTWEMKFGKAK